MKKQVTTQLNLNKFQEGGTVLKEVTIDGRNPKIISKEFLTNWINNPEFLKRLSNNLQQREDVRKEQDSFYDHRYKGIIDKYVNKNSPNKDAKNLQESALRNINETGVYLGEVEDEAFSKLTNETFSESNQRRERTRGVFDPTYKAVWVEDNNKNFQTGVLTHELTHASRLDKELKEINPDSNLVKDKNYKLSKEMEFLLPYINKSNEIYPRIMQIRYESKIKPGEYIDSDRMDQIYEDLVDSEDLFKVYSKEQVREMLNNLAVDTQNNNMLVAKNGGIMKQNVIQVPKEIFENIFFKEGGQKEEAFINTLAGGVQYGMNEEAPISEPNAELEKGEWILDSQGLRVVLGDTHEDGGEKMVLEDGAQILSNYLETPKALLNSLNKEYNTKIKSKTTYAEALSQVYKKIGLDKLQEEQKALIEKVKFQQENTKDANTQMANIEILSNKIKEIEDRKQPLQVQAQEVFSRLFEKQEGSKPKEEIEVNQNAQIYAQEGGTIPNWQILNQYALPQYGYQTFQPNGVAGVEVDKTLSTPETQKLFPSLSQKHFQNGVIRPQDNLQFQTDINSYYTDALKSAEKLYGTDSDKYKQISTFISQNNFVNKKGDIRYTDNVYGDFTSTRPNIALELLPEEEFTRLKSEGINTVGQLKNKYPAIYEEFVSTYDAPDDLWLAPFEETTLEEVTVNSDKKDNKSNDKTNITREKIEDRMGVFNAPDQTPILPTSLEAHLKTNRRYERADFTAISPEAQLQEIARNQVRSEQNLDLLPSSVKAGVLANMGANVSEIANKVISQVQQVNNQAFQNIQNYNRQVQNQEENASAQDALNFEQRQLLAKARTDNDIANWFNVNQRNQLRNFDTINNLNLVNTNADNFQLTDRGIEQRGGNMDFLDRIRNSTAQQFSMTPEQLRENIEAMYGKEFLERMSKKPKNNK